MLIEIFSDVVCPWCYIGKRRLDMVMQTEIGEGVELAWRPYQLYPNIPAGGLLREDVLRARHPEADDEDLETLKRKVPSRIRAEAQGVGIEFDFAAMATVPNTRLAHRLLMFVEDVVGSLALQHELAEELFSLHFCHGRDVGDANVLLEAARRLGLDVDAVRGYLAGDSGSAALDRELARAVDVGVSGVPGFLLGGRFLLPGAQTPEVIGQFISRAKERLG
jgi:predicted DsbA family dithiol-disulfide isomerase